MAWCGCPWGGRGKGRAPGGCLGAKRRGRTRHAAKSPGEPRAGFDPGVSEWGNPPPKGGTAARIHRAAGLTRGTETSQYPEERTSTETPSVAASERGPGQRPGGANRNRLGSRARAGDSPVRAEPPLGPRVGRDTRNPARTWGDHPPSLSTPWRPIANQYREGKVKSSATSAVKQTLKPGAHKQSGPDRPFWAGRVTAYLLHNGSASCGRRQA